MPTLASPELTGAWEARLARIARGQETRAAFMGDIARYVRDMIDAIRGIAGRRGAGRQRQPRAGRRAGGASAPRRPLPVGRRLRRRPPQRR